MRAFSQRGLTFIELMTVMIIAAVLATLAIPSFGDQLARRRLEGVATDLSTDLQYARSQAVNTRADVRLRTTVGGTTYVIDNVGSTTTYKTTVLPDGITVTDGVTVSYDALRGAASITPATPLALASSHTSASMRLDVNMTGRVSLCSPGGTLKGYATC